MQTLVIFILVLCCITYLITRHNLPPFPVLVTGALVYGLLTGMGADTVPQITGGIGAVFALLGIPIFSGAVIAKALRSGPFLERITADIRRFTRKPEPAAGLAGYILSVPMMCCITPFIVLSPLVGQLHEDTQRTRRLLYITAFGSVLSFVLLYPLPVVYPVVKNMNLIGFDVGTYTIIALPLSLLLLLFGILFFRSGEPGIEAGTVSEKPPTVSPWRAWGPVAIPILLISVGHIVPTLTILGNINIALLAGALYAVAITPFETRPDVLGGGTKNAGIILFDLCGAGAFGHVIAASTFADDIFRMLGSDFPILLVPFVLAALIQTAQGSRVVTAVVTAAIIARIPAVASIPAVPLILMVAAGTLVFSFVSDPYFWLIRRTTGDDVATVVKNYTLPLAGAGLIILCSGLVISAFL
jgi:GntP family gluconate:H+ symporter